MEADTDAVPDAFGKNGQVRQVFWTLFITTAGLVPAPGYGPGNSSAGGRDNYGNWG